MGFSNIPVALGEQLLLHVKMANPTHALEYSLEKLEIGDLTGNLLNDNTKKAFWINIYNAYFQILSVRERKAKPEIFRQKLIIIAGRKFSLDDIEHGILRKYRWKFSLGYLPQLFPSDTIRKLAVSTIDYRIHFALNCGAKSCPPIAFYKIDSIEKQLDLATQSFLENETIVDEEKKLVTVTKLMRWFKGDFGGKDGIKTILARYLRRDFKSFTISYSEYNWDTSLNNFT
jgi:hypothetical protein